MEVSHNRLLAALPDEDYARLLPALTPVPFTFKKFFHKQGDRIDSIVFPSSGVASVVNVMADGLSRYSQAFRRPSCSRPRATFCIR